ncbi:hypothetical protein [Azospirillum cavernae]|uniref:hypothetical protein n=1 Tax=Azospirillum cavernae TaxID=2320860 RepID=UPI0011C3CCC2|nr:hypothetical protein [Azospirillum cavernae]
MDGIGQQDAQGRGHDGPFDGPFERIYPKALAYSERKKPTNIVGLYREKPAGRSPLAALARRLAIAGQVCGLCAILNKGCAGQPSGIGKDPFPFRFPLMPRKTHALCGYSLARLVQRTSPSGSGVATLAEAANLAHRQILPASKICRWFNFAGFRRKAEGDASFGGKPITRCFSVFVQ